jgi:hypothetical protein
MAISAELANKIISKQIEREIAEASPNLRVIIMPDDKEKGSFCEVDSGDLRHHILWAWAMSKLAENARMN